MTETAVPPADTYAETWPRVRRDVLYTETPDGVLFHNASGGFHLNGASAYKLATLVLPFLNGEHRLGNLLAALGPGQQAMVGELVRMLTEQGFARDAAEDREQPVVLDEAVAGRFAEQIAYVDHYANRAASRFAAFRASSITVVGGGEAAAWCALGLLRNGAGTVRVLTPPGAAADFTTAVAEAGALTDAGCPAELTLTPQPDRLGWADLAGSDFVIVADDRGPRQLTALLAAGPIPDGTRLLPMWPIGAVNVVGPLGEPGAAVCWWCAALRISWGIGEPVAAGFWSAVANPRLLTAPAPAVTGPLAAMVGNLLAFEAFRVITEVLPADTAGRVVLQDGETLSATSAAILPHPACAHTTAATVAPRLSEGAPAPRFSVDDAQDGDVADALLAELNERTTLVDPRAGVFHEFTDEPWTQSPLKVSTVRFPTGPGVFREVAAFDLHNLANARLAALCTAAAAYVEAVVPLPAAAPITAPVVAAESLATFSGLTAGAVPAQAVAASSLTGGGEVALPGAAVRTRSDANHALRFVPTTAGTGAGLTPEQATANAALSALTYTAVDTLLRGGTATLVDLTGADSPELTFLTRSAANVGATVELLDLSPADPRRAPVLLARATVAGQDEPVWAVSGQLRWLDAAIAALRDVVGQAQVRLERAGDVDQGDPLVPGLDPATIAPTGRGPARTDAATTWDAVTEALREAGEDLLAVAVPVPDLESGGIHVVKVLHRNRTGDVG